MNANTNINLGQLTVTAASAANISSSHINASPVNTAARTFGDVLSRAVDTADSLKFSKHASARINSREVELSPDQLRRVEEGVSRAKNKGVADSLVLVDGYALVVNTRSRTVVTAMDSRQTADDQTLGKVFTNIDGAVIV